MVVIPCLRRVPAKDGLVCTNKDPCRGQFLGVGTCQQNDCVLFVDKVVPFLVGSKDCHLPQTAGAYCVCRLR